MVESRLASMIGSRVESMRSTSGWGMAVGVEGDRDGEGSEESRRGSEQNRRRIGRESGVELRIESIIESMGGGASFPIPTTRNAIPGATLECFPFRVWEFLLLARQGCYDSFVVS